MERYLIRNTQSGVEIGVFEANDAREALELMAHEAGYSSYADACKAAPADIGEIAITEIG